MNVFFSSSNGKIDTLSSGVYTNQAVVEALIDGQNEKAKEMNIKARYQLGTCLKSELPVDIKVRN